MGLLFKNGVFANSVKNSTKRFSTSPPFLFYWPNISSRVVDHSRSRHLSLRTWSPLQWRYSSYESVQTEGSTRRNETLAYSKLSNKDWKLLENGSGCTLWNFSGQYQIITDKDNYLSLTFAEEAQFIWVD